MTKNKLKLGIAYYSGLILILLAIASYYNNKGNLEEVQQTPVSVNNNALTPAPVQAVPFFENKQVAEAKIIKSLEISPSDTIVIVGPIEDNGNELAQEIIQKSKKNKSINVVINSPGGSVLDGALIVSAIQSSKVPVNTVCMQLCASMAALIHQYGTQRLMVDRSILMFHAAQGQLQGYFPHMRSRLEMFDKFFQRMNQYVADRVGWEREKLEQAEDRELWMDSDDAIAKKFADGLVSVSLGSSSIGSPAMKLVTTPNFDKNKTLGLVLKNAR